MTVSPAAAAPVRTTCESGRLAGDGGFLPSPGATALAGRGMELAGLRAGARVVDIGCGDGNAVEHLRHSLGLAAAGLDLAPALGCRTAPWLRAAGERLPFASGTLDGLLVQCTLSVVRHQERVLAECSRVLVRGGKLVIADLYARAPKAIDRVRELPAACLSGILVREELEERLVSHGVEIRIWEDHSSLLRDFLLRFVMERGQVERLWERGEGTGPEARRIGEALKDVRPGYFLAVAARDEG